VKKLAFFSKTYVLIKIFILKIITSVPGVDLMDQFLMQLADKDQTGSDIGLKYDFSKFFLAPLNLSR
jgi:hypothetical protein